MPNGFIPCTTYWVKLDNKIIGLANIKHYLNDNLRKNGGHIGLSISKNYRKKGYGLKALKLLIEKAQNDFGISDILLTNDPKNAASRALCEKIGAELTDIDEYCHYWIKNGEEIIMNNNLEVVFESENIKFVKLSFDLIDDYLIMINDVSVSKNISHNPKTFTYEEEKSWIEEKLKNNAVSFSMIEKSTGEFIGNIEIMSIKNGIGEIGITITPNKQNKHYGREALKAIMEYGYQNLGIKGYELNVFSTNKRAIKCYRNVGFIEDGIGKTENDIHMKISR